MIQLYFWIAFKFHSLSWNPICRLSFLCLNIILLLTGVQYTHKHSYWQMLFWLFLKYIISFPDTWSQCVHFGFLTVFNFHIISYGLSAFLVEHLLRQNDIEIKKLLQRAKQTRKLCFILLYCWMLVSLFAYVWYIFLFHIYFRQFISSVGANHVKKYETFFEICRKIDNRVTTMLVDL